MNILTDPATATHAPWCDTEWHDAENQEVYEMAVREGFEDDPGYANCSSGSIEVPAGTSHGSALIHATSAGPMVSVEFPHRPIDLDAAGLDATVETLTRIAVTLRACEASR